MKSKEDLNPCPNCGESDQEHCANVSREWPYLWVEGTHETYCLKCGWNTMEHSDWNKSDEAWNRGEVFPYVEPDK